MTMNNVMLGRVHPDPCPECGEKLILKYGYKYKHYFYGCENWPICSGSAGAHNDGTPMGKAVKKEIATQRVIAHALINRLKQQRGWSGNDTYRWMTQLFKTNETVHIANMDMDDLKFLFRETQKELKYK